MSTTRDVSNQRKKVGGCGIVLKRVSLCRRVCVMCILHWLTTDSTDRKNQTNATHIVLTTNQKINKFAMEEAEVWMVHFGRTTLCTRVYIYIDRYRVKFYLQRRNDSE